ncbi:MAG: polysaccharide deacetylase family protein [Alphaproteobacteria bacterium]|nr:polysaccharide deacetylase family protein [Alphaproteobacteria bacterium]
MTRRISTITGCLLAALALPLWTYAAAAGCHAGALGTARVLAVDPAATPAVGRKHFPATLPLAPREVVLTFDDGPWPGPTERVLAALRDECVRASFFMLGRNATAHAGLARRVLAEGHTVGHHSHSHPLLNRMPVERAIAEVERGFASVETALYGAAGAEPRTPFFRFPGFASSPVLLDILARRRIAVFGADLWASDWNPMPPARQLEQVLGRLDAAGSGIVLFHDTQPQTAAMLPALLRELKTRGYRVVHAVPAAAAGAVKHVRQR